MPDPKKKSSALMRTALGGSAILVIAGLGAFWYASQKAQQQAPKEEGDVVTVTIEGKVCKPNEITVPAGRTTFRIVNNSDRALEWEILDGIMVVEERENIAPGFAQTMRVKLRPGDYDITCGLLSNPRGKLHVTPSADSEAEAARPSAVNFLGALAEYRFEEIFPGCRIIDIHEFLLEKGVKLQGIQGTEYLYHDPCHTPIKTMNPTKLAGELLGKDVVLSDRCCGESGMFATKRPDIASQVKFRKQEEIEKNLAQLPPAEQVKIITTCPACMQGLSRYEEDNNIKADYIVIEMARGILGETWQDDFVQKAKNGGVEQVLL